MAFVKVHVYDRGYVELNTDLIMSIKADREENQYITMTDGDKMIVESRSRFKLKEAMELKVKSGKRGQTPWRVYRNL